MPAAMPWLTAWNRAVTLAAYSPTSSSMTRARPVLAPVVDEDELSVEVAVLESLENTSCQLADVELFVEAGDDYRQIGGVHWKAALV